MRRRLACGLISLVVTPPMLASAGDTDALRLVHADRFSVVFMRNDIRSSAPVTGETEVLTWTFFDKTDRLTRSWGWNTRISRTRIDCSQGRMADLSHQTFRDLELVGETRPSNAMTAPIGPEKAAILAHACQTADPAFETVVADMAAARAWAARAYPGLSGEIPNADP